MSPRGVTASCGSHTPRPTWSVTPTVSETLGTQLPGVASAAQDPRALGPSPSCPSCHPGCTDDIVTSDHSPVFATFEVGVTSQFVPKEGKGWGLSPLRPGLG